MKRTLLTAFLLITLFVLQGTFFQTFNFGGSVPNLLIVLVVSAGLMRGEKAGILTGFFAGILVDIFSGSGAAIGLYALIYMYIGYANGSFSKIFFPEDIKLPIVMIIVSDIFYGLLVYILMFLLQGKTDMGYYFKHVILPETVYTIFITILLYPFLLWLHKLLLKDELRKVKKFVS